MMGSGWVAECSGPSEEESRASGKFCMDTVVNTEPQALKIIILKTGAGTQKSRFPEASANTWEWSGQEKLVGALAL